MPTTVAIPIDLIAAALTGGEGAGLRAWGLIRAVDPEGRGRLPRKLVLARLRALGLSGSTASRVVQDALGQGFAELGQAGPSRRPTVVLKGTARLLAELGAGVGRDRVAVPVEWLLRPSYKRVLGLAATARHNHEPIARATKADLYGLSASSQRRAERDLGAAVEAVVVVHRLHRHADVASFPAIDGRRCFVRKADPKSVYERKPNSTAVPLDVTLRPWCRHSPAPKASGEPTSPPPRSYFRKPDTARRAAKRRGRRGEATGGIVVADRAVELAGRRVRTWLPCR